MIEPEKRSTVVEQLREIWRREREPEAKLALADVIIHIVVSADGDDPDWLL